MGNISIFQYHWTLWLIPQFSYSLPTNYHIYTGDSKRDRKTDLRPSNSWASGGWWMTCSPLTTLASHTLLAPQSTWCVPTVSEDPLAGTITPPRRATLHWLESNTSSILILVSQNVTITTITVAVAATNNTTVTGFHLVVSMLSSCGLYSSMFPHAKMLSHNMHAEVSFIESWHLSFFQYFTVSCKGTAPLLTV